MKFVTMQVFSSYSLLQSTIKLDEYVQLGKQLGYDSLALTDNGVMHAAIDFYQICLKQGIRPIIGCRFLLESLPFQEGAEELIVYAKDYEGYLALMKLSTIYQEEHQTDEFFSCIREATDHLQILHIKEQNSIWMDEKQLKKWMKDWQQVFSFPQAIAVEKDLLDLPQLEHFLQELKESGYLPIAHKKTYYLRTNDHFSWTVLKAIEQGQSISTEQLDMTGTYYLHEEQSVHHEFAKYPELLEDLGAFIGSLNVEIKLGQRLLPKFPTPEQMEATVFLKQLCQQSLQEKIGDVKDYQERLEYELEIIHQMGFDDYFLIVWDIMRFAKEQSIQTGPGRGSAAGSLVAYLLEITQVDPIQYQLLFERFLNPSRNTMPDIDLDFPDNRREELLQYVYHKYGASHVAQIATFGTLAAKQSLRDVARVMGLSQEEIGRWSKAVPNQLRITLQEARKHSKVLEHLIQASPRNERLFETACRIEGLPRHMSTHAAGVIISDQPLVRYAPTIKRVGELPITQYTMKPLEQIGLLKMDFLGLKNLTILADAVDFVQQVYQEHLDIQKIPLIDAQTLKIFQTGETNGIFQFESSGIKNVLKLVHPEGIEDIAAVNALYRPGPMQQIDVFSKRKLGKENIQYPHKDLEPILQNTYGIMVYQEQVMQVTSTLAGFSLSEADILRRAISKKDGYILEKERAHFIKGASEKGYSQEVAEQVYQYIERFANYGFNRSHAFAYGFLAYQLAYIKAHYPLAFFAAVIKSASQSGKEDSYLLEAKQKGIKILPPSVQSSLAEFSVTAEGIRIGLRSIKGIRRELANHILSLRKEYGEFQSFFDFGFKLGKRYCRKEYLQPFIQAGALDCFGDNRASLLASMDALVESVSINGLNVPLDVQNELFPKMEIREELPLLTILENEMAVLGYTISAHPSEEFHELYQEGILQAVAGIHSIQKVQLVGTIQEIKKIRTKKGELMAFIGLQDFSGRIEMTLFQNLYPQYFRYLEVGNLVAVHGKTERSKEGTWKLQIDKIEEVTTLRRMKETVKQTCFIKIQKELQTPDIYEKISRIVKNYPGFSNIYLYLDSEKKTVSLPAKTGFNPTKESLQLLEELVGAENVKIKNKL